MKKPFVYCFLLIAFMAALRASRLETDLTLLGSLNNLKSGATFTVKSGSTFIVESGATFNIPAASLPSAAADGISKGVATFTAADFNAASGVISIDYTNGQAASGSTKGFLTSTDWTTFNAKFGTSTKADVLDAAFFASDAGASDTYTATLSPAITGYVTGAHYRFKANTANTGAATINFNSLGAKTIKKAAGGITTDLADNDIRAGQWVDLVYDGTNMQMQSLLGNAASGGGVPAGSTGEIQFNSSGSFGSSSTFLYSSGVLSLGAASSSAATGTLLVYGSSDPTSIGTIRRGSADAFSGGWSFSKSRGSIASPSAVLSGDVCGSIWAGGYTGSAHNDFAARLAFVATENWSGSANGNQLVFSVTPNGSTGRTDRFWVNNDGTISAGSAPTVLTDSAGKILASALNTVTVAKGGTGTSDGSITGTSALTFTANGSSTLSLVTTGLVYVNATKLAFDSGGNEFTGTPSAGSGDMMYAARGAHRWYADTNNNDGSTGVEYEWHTQEAQGGTSNVRMKMMNDGKLIIGTTTNDATNLVQIAGDIATVTGGKTLKVKSGTNAKAGTFTLSSGGATVSNTSVTANSVVVMSLKTASGSITQAPYLTAITAGTSFVVAAGAGDNSTYNYVIFEVN